MQERQSLDLSPCSSNVNFSFVMRAERNIQDMVQDCLHMLYDYFNYIVLVFRGRYTERYLYSFLSRYLILLETLKPHQYAKAEIFK